MSELDLSLENLKEKRKNLIHKYNKLPKRDSFSGWRYLSEIEKIENQIEKLGGEID